MSKEFCTKVNRSVDRFIGDESSESSTCLGLRWAFKIVQEILFSGMWERSRSELPRELKESDQLCGFLAEGGETADDLGIIYELCDRVVAEITMIEQFGFETDVRFFKNGSVKPLAIIKIVFGTSGNIVSVTPFIPQQGVPPSTPKIDDPGETQVITPIPRNGSGRQPVAVGAGTQ